MRLRSAFALLLCVFSTGPGMASPSYPATPVPTWVDYSSVAPVPATTRADDADAVYLRREDQISLLGAEPQLYRRRVVELMRTSAVGDWSTINIDVAPSFESLQIHHVRIWRDGRWLDKFADARVSTLQRGQGLDNGLVDDTRTVSLVLNDVRVGDVLDFDYTVTGANPVFGGHYVKDLPVASTMPVRHRLIRILRPSSIRLEYRLTGPELRRTSAPWNGGIEERWSADDLPAFTVDKGAPAWYMPYGLMQVSAFGNWSAVARWARGLYRAEPATPGVRALAERLRRKHPDDRGAQLLAALRFVQDEIRYTGIEIGEGSHQPRAPDVVLQTRYGDCKDKVLLLVSTWRALGAQAWPALVSTWQGSQLPRRLPTPLAFDHVVALLSWQGREWWLDATVSLQRGSLETTAQADFGHALVVRDGTAGLTAMPSAMPSTPQIEVTTVLDLRKADGTLADAGDMEIHTVYSGAQADGVRASHARSSTADIARNYLNYLTNYFPGAQMAAPLEMKDDPVANRIDVTEHYRLGDVWHEDADKPGVRRGEFWLAVIAGYATRPGSPRRTSPYAPGYPSYVRERLEVRLDDNWSVQHEDNNVATEWFDVRGSMDMQSDRLVVQSAYRTLARAVPAADVGKYDDAMRRARSGFTYTLTMNANAAVSGSDRVRNLWTAIGTDLRWLWVLASVLALTVGAALTAFYRGDNPAMALWTRPRQVARDVVARHGDGVAFALLAASSVATNLVPDKESHPLLKFGLVAGGVTLLLSACLAAGVQMLLCRLVAWLSRRWGGMASAAAVRQIAAWSVVPMIASAIPGLAMIGMFGLRAAVAPSGAMLPSMLLDAALTVVFGIWSMVCFVAMLAEVARIGVGRAIGVIVSYLLCLAVPVGIVVALWYAATH